jgi:aminoglycoside phosphotransferase (APT) family kinase protein
MDAPPGLDLQRLRDHLERRRPGLLSGPLTAEIITGGRSNLTYVVRDTGDADGDPREWVLRRPPLGHVLATAHDMAREYRVMTALGPTAVPVPRTVLLCEDLEVLGAPFYLMERVAGTVFRNRAQLEAAGPERTRAIGNRLVDTLVDLHAVDITSAGLGDFGRPEGYLERQLRRWSRQLESSRNRDLPGIEELHSELAAGLPAGAEGVVLHGDYRLDNVIVGAADEVAAVLDWEMSTLGDPMADVALLAAYRDRRSLSAADPVGDATQAPGFPTVQDMVARYAERSGRDVSGLAWYVAFSYFKLAVILEGIHYRFIHGQTVGAGFDRVGEMVPGLVTAGLNWVHSEWGKEREGR